MPSDISLPLLPNVADPIAAHHEGGITEQDCLACSSPCCSQGGFAILENVIQVYDRYKAGTLKRDDFDFKTGRSFREFVFEYFDIYVQRTGRLWWKKDIVFFHMKSLSDGGTPISIPPGGGFWETRKELFERNPWLNKGCVFLSKKAPNWPEDDGDASRHCILHTPDVGKRITEKPIDCVFFTCDTPREFRTPSQQTTKRWFRALAVAYPDSVKRFDALIAEPGSR